MSITSKRTVHIPSIGQAALVGGDIPATITAVCIRGNQMTYECAFWDGRTYHRKWFESYEVVLERGGAGLQGDGDSHIQFVVPERAKFSLDAKDD